jgi:Ca-activated chloride channel family protein
MNREQAEKLPAALIFDDLDESSKTEFLAYLQTDDELRERLADMRMAAKVASDTLQHGPEPVLGKRRLKSLAKLAKCSSAKRTIFTMPRLAAAAAVGIVALLSAFIMLPSLNRARVYSSSLLGAKPQYDIEFAGGTSLAYTEGDERVAKADLGIREYHHEPTDMTQMYAMGTEIRDSAISRPETGRTNYSETAPVANGPITNDVVDYFANSDFSGITEDNYTVNSGKPGGVGGVGQTATTPEGSVRAIEPPKSPSPGMPGGGAGTTMKLDTEPPKRLEAPGYTGGDGGRGGNGGEIDGDATYFGNKAVVSNATINGRPDITGILNSGGVIAEADRPDIFGETITKPESKPPSKPMDEAAKSFDELDSTLRPQDMPDKYKAKLRDSFRQSYGFDLVLDRETPGKEHLSSGEWGGWGAETGERNGKKPQPILHYKAEGRDRLSILSEEEAGSSPGKAAEKYGEASAGDNVLFMDGYTSTDTWLVMDESGLPREPGPEGDKDYNSEATESLNQGTSTKGRIPRVPLPGEIPLVRPLVRGEDGKKTLAEEQAQRATKDLEGTKRRSGIYDKGGVLINGLKPEDNRAFALDIAAPGGNITGITDGRDGGWNEAEKLSEKANELLPPKLNTPAIKSTLGSSKPPAESPSSVDEVQKAIDAAKNGDTVVVKGGSYNGKIDYAGKEITIVSSNPDDPSKVAKMITSSESAFDFAHGDPNKTLVIDRTDAVGREDEPELPAASCFKVVPVNPWVVTGRDSLSTFALDVDTASYTLCRRYIRGGFLPPAGAVRMEEFINYFNYHYPQRANAAFAVHAQAAQSPFARKEKNLTLLKVGVKARTIGRDQRRAAHLVFVVDASASMGQPDRLPLVQKALKLLLDKLSEGDRISVITCANEARLHLEAVSASEREKILGAIDAIQPFGPTNLLAGLKLGYAAARRAFAPKQINHVILCSDGVANIGQTEAEAVLNEVAADRKQGVTITCVGVGYGSYNDAFLEALANRGDGSYVFLDAVEQAQRVFVEQLAATLQPVARDARIQVDFNPNRVRRYRLIGYENRDIEDKRFRDDTIDAGEVGSGQCSTALYEMELTGQPSEDQQDDLGTVFVRYRDVETGRIEEISNRLKSSIVRRCTVESAPRFFLAAGAARFAEILRQSEHAQAAQASWGDGSLKDVLRVMEQVNQALPLDRDVRELTDLIREAEHLPASP